MTTDVARSKPGPKPTEPPKNAAERILGLSAAGSTKKGIAYLLGCKLEVLNRWLSEHDELQEAFDQGREREHKALFTVLYDKAMAGDTVSALFLLKTRHGYREGDQTDTANRVSITFNLPAALKPEQYDAIIENGNTQVLPVPRARLRRS